MAVRSSPIRQECPSPRDDVRRRTGTFRGVDRLGGDVPANQRQPHVAARAAPPATDRLIKPARMTVRAHALLRVQQRHGREIAWCHRRSLIQPIPAPTEAGDPAQAPEPSAPPERATWPMAA